MTRWRGPILGGLGVLIAVLSGLAGNLGTGLVPDRLLAGREWVVGVLIVVLLVAGILLAVADRRHDDGRAPVTQVFLPPLPLPPAMPAAHSNLPPRNPAFTGREALLADIAARLESGPVAVRGLGGIGKSQAALEYAHRSSYAITWWVRADSPLTLSEDLAALAPALGLPAVADQEATVAGVRAALERRSDWLLVLDNATDPASAAAWLPRGPGHVLVTSRDRGWEAVGAQLDLAVFDRSESVDYLRRRLGRDDPGAADLAEALGDLPLALAQAAAYLSGHDLSIARFLVIYRDRAAAGRLLAERTGDGYPESVATTWSLHLDGLDPAATDLLRLCAHLDPGDIDLSLLLTGPDRLDGPLAAALGTADGLENAIGALTRTSLVTRLDDDRVRLHRLVADVTRRDIPDPDPWTARALALVLAAFPDEPWNYETWPVCARLVAHVAVVARDSRTVGAAVLLSRLGQYAHARGEYEPATTFLELALELEEELSDPDNFAIAIALTNLGIAQRSTGRVTAALASQHRALAISEAVHGPDSAETAVILTNLGTTQGAAKEYAAANASLERALAIKASLYEPEHEQLAITLHNLALAQQEAGDLPAARANAERALAIEEAVNGPRHPEVARTLINLGALRELQGEPEAARDAYRRALEICEATLDPAHPRTTEARRRLADL